MEHTRVLIVGSGPAGLTAAIYSARAQLSPIVIEGEPSSTTDQPGGQLMLTTDIENFPGFVEGLTGPELMANMRAQAERFGADLRVAKVTRLDVEARPFRAWLSGEEEPSISADAVILATGAQSLMLNVPGEDRLLSHGVSTCATCDGFFFRGQDIAVIGGGDSAIEEATFLTRFANSVTIVHRRDSLRASKIMQQRARDNEKIRFAWNTRVLEVLGDDKVTGLRVADTISAEERVLDVTGVFIAIGHVPNTRLVAGVADLDENGYVRTGPGSFTNIEGLFAAGDVQDHVYRQAITAAGSGCTAAIDAERWLEAQDASTGR
ncbi:MAG: thioredoxin-disulfide reductase [Acidimicrobiales bacterium]